MNPFELHYPPSSDEIRSVGAAVGSGSQIAKLLHLGTQGGRTWRRWVAGESDISFGNWFALNAFAQEISARNKSNTAAL